MIFKIDMAWRLKNDKHQGLTFDIPIETKIITDQNMYLLLKGFEDCNEKMAQANLIAHYTF